MAGFPRAGSTLLSNILNQNPEFLGTATSGLIGTFINVRDNWRQSDIYKSNPEEYIYSKIQSLLKNIICGFYEDELSNDIIPIDKNRGWTGFIDLLEEIFQCKIKIIFPIRNIIDILISMEKVNRKSTATNHGDNGNWLNEQTTIGRAENFLKDDGILGLPMLRFREILYRKQLDRLVIVSYDNLLNHPRKTLDKIHEELEIELFNYDLNNIKQTIVEHDLDHGFSPNSLHKIKEGRILPPKQRDTMVFDSNYINQIENERYKDISQLINNIKI
ncbi:MAG: sulfotransferase [bacterium]